MYLRVSKYLDVPAHVRRLITASAFPLVFTLHIVLVWGVLPYSQCFLILNYQTNMIVEIVLNYGLKNSGTVPYFRGD